MITVKKLSNNDDGIADNLMNPASALTVGDDFEDQSDCSGKDINVMIDNEDDPPADKKDASEVVVEDIIQCMETNEHGDSDGISDILACCTDSENVAKALDENDVMPLLTEKDIPGASLNGKKPSELKVVQLKRWLNCRDAPVSGKKPELIQRVCDYIKYGWDRFLIDPDGGTNVQQKLQAEAAHSDIAILQSVPKSNDMHWSKQIYRVPKITFGMIFDFIVERKVLAQKANCIDDASEKRDDSFLCCQNEDMSLGASTTGDPIVYTRSLDKAYRFFQDGHVQNVRYHPMPAQPDFVCVGASVLPSMKKDRMYNVFVILSKLSTKVKSAFCVCPAGLSGCCNHVTATLYYIEEYFRLGLDEEDKKGCTEKLQTWIQPRKKKVDARPTNLVSLSKSVYGVEKRSKVYKINKWDCRPTSRRIAQPARKANLWNRLMMLDQSKKDAATSAVNSATNSIERKKANATQSMLSRYGTSCFLQLFDAEPAPSVNRSEQIREERIARAAAEQLKFKHSLSKSVNNVNHDHCYPNSVITASQYKVKDKPAPQHLLRTLYEEHICIGPTEAVQLELTTRDQSKSDLWHKERKLRITSSVMKSVCNRRPTTDHNSFIKNKLAPKPINSAAIKHGQRYEDTAIRCYLEHQDKKGLIVKIKRCGLFVNPAIPWLAATPDSVVEIGPDTGCLEVKCPFVCSTISFTEASLKPSFCLEKSNGRLQLKRKHQYYYQVQTQLFVTQLFWCDFVVWSPTEGILVERIDFDELFTANMVSKARSFYFDTFLPSVVACTTIRPSSMDITPLATAAYVCTKMALQEEDKEEKMNDAGSDVQLLSVCEVSRPSIDLQQLDCVRHNVDGDGNCLFYAIAHQMGLIGQNCHGDHYVADQLRTLALACMQKFPDVRLEDGMTVCQWKQKKLHIIQNAQWGGDLEIRLLAIALERDVVVISGLQNTFTSARRFPCHPPPIPKMRGGIFIPVNVTELAAQWKYYNPRPLLIIYNDINHYDSTIYMNNFK
ncbi:uncharacterized protein [Dysidea avara]|uniref:uncharacterized protein isoform X2 n=1 Tax=Dysidea avara TaxID=196820 RepID=UPI00331B06FD